jgi:hypothetical protein
MPKPQALIDFMSTKNFTILYNYFVNLDDNITDFNKKKLNKVIFDCFSNSNNSSDKTEENFWKMIRPKFTFENQNDLNNHINEINQHYYNYKDKLVKNYIKNMKNMENMEKFIGMDMSEIVLKLHDTVVNNLNSPTQGGKRKSRKSKKAKKAKKAKKSQKTKKAKKSRKKNTKKINRKTRRH